jgi:hypothetical protein
MATLQPRGLMPDALIDPAKRADAITWILLAPHSQAWKVDLLRGWGYETGTRLTAREYDLVRSSGIPTTPVKVQKP